MFGIAGALLILLHTGHRVGHSLNTAILAVINRRGPRLAWYCRLPVGFFEIVVWLAGGAGNHAAVLSYLVTDTVYLFGCILCGRLADGLAVILAVGGFRQFFPAKTLEIRISEPKAEDQQNNEDREGVNPFAAPNLDFWCVLRRFYTDSWPAYRGCKA